MTAALMWVLRAYIAFYSFVGLFVVVLMAVGLLGRFRSIVLARLDDVRGPTWPELRS